MGYRPDSLADPTDDTDRATVALAALGLGLIWPLTLAFYAIRDWLWRPADLDRSRKDGDR